MTYQAGFWSGFYEDEGCKKPPFPISIDGHKDRAEENSDKDDCSLLAFVNAKSKEDAWKEISTYFPDYTKRFISEVEDETSPFSH